MKKTAAILLALFLVFSLSLTAFADLGPPGPDPRDEIPNNGDQSLDGDLQAKEDTEAPEDDATEEAETEKDAAQTQTEAATESTEPATEASSQAQYESATLAPSANADSQAGAANDAVNHTVIIVVVICGTILLLMLIVIAVLLLKKKQPDGDDDPDEDDGAVGLPVRIEVLSGACYNAKLDFRLRRNLTIGTDSGCDLVFDDAMMLPLHAVISLDADTVMLEECADSGVTCIGGMKIFAPNRLRSGDIITIGNTSFAVFFE